MNSDDARPDCRCCGAPDPEFVGSKVGTFLKRDFAYWRCPACDLTFVDPFPGYEVYDQAYYEGRGADPYVSYESEYRDYRSTDRLLEFDDLFRLASLYAVKNLPQGPIDWLDFGCGAGGLLKYLADAREIRSRGRSWPVRVAGHDVGAYADRLRKVDGFRILGLGDLESAPSGSFDIISMIEVVEHMEHPDNAFALASRLLRPGGLLLLTTGNIASPVARRKGLDYAYCLPEIHVALFTPRALSFLYARNGLEPVLVRYDGTVRFKVVKTLRKGLSQTLARLALRVPGVVRAIDLLYGTSAMPCARKPGAPPRFG